MSQTVGGVTAPVIFAILLVVFWTTLFLLKQFAKARLERVGLDVNVPIVLWRTKRFNYLLDAIARRARSFWKIIGTLGFAVSLGLIPVAVYFMSQAFFPYFVTQAALYGPEPLRRIAIALFGSQIDKCTSSVTQCTSPVTLFLPGVTVSLNSIFDWTLILALLVVLVVHEGSHGVLARAEGIVVKNSGLLLLLVIPGAFVEPDEEQLGKAKKISQLRILSAGTSANFTVGLIFLLLVANLGVYYATISPFFQPSAGVLVTDVVPNSAASNATIRAGQAITQMSNATLTYPIHDEFDFQAALNVWRPGQTITVSLVDSSTLQTSSVSAHLSQSPTNSTKAFLGVTTFFYYPARFPSVLSSFAAASIYRLYNNIFLFSVGIAAINMLPIWGLDGDRVVKLLLQKLFGSHQRAAASSLTAARILSISLIALAAITTYALHGIVNI